MPFNNIIPTVKQIFVGRKSELKDLEDLWTFSQEDVEHFVYVVLNAPGVGKTTLINHFGNDIEKSERGLFLKLTCSHSYDTIFRLNKDILNLLEDKVRVKKRLIDHFIENIKDGEQRKWKKEKLNQHVSMLGELTKKEAPTINDIRDIFSAISKIIPIFFAADEIQEFQKGMVPIINEDGETYSKETLLHYFTQILKDLLNIPMLLVLSGTRYHILSQIGDKIGSPIRHKVQSLIIGNFNSSELNTYAHHIENFIRAQDIETNNVPTLMKHYQAFLKSFSGGHPRTIERITITFLNNLSSLIHNKYCQNKEGFFDFLMHELTETFSATILSSELKKKLKDFETNKCFSIVKEWMIDAGTTGLFLGNRPNHSDPILDEEIKQIVYELMNIGIIIQNGQTNYYLTSYFHLLEFLKLYNEPYEQFLNQVMSNKYFQLICCSHSGLGYTFENIFTAALFINQNNSDDIPISSVLIRQIIRLPGEINWSDFFPESNILYHVPTAKSIDAIILENQEIALIQITTAFNPKSKKIDQLYETVKDLGNQDSIKKRKINVIGWMVSLYDFKSLPELPSNIYLTSGKKLEFLMGKELISRLKKVKKEFSQEISL